VDGVGEMLGFLSEMIRKPEPRAKPLTPNDLPARPSTNDSAEDRVIAEKKRAALSYLTTAWDEALEQGIDPEILAHAALFAALSDLIEIYGEEAVSDFVGGLDARVMRGEFTLPGTVQ